VFSNWRLEGVGMQERQEKVVALSEKSLLE